jgi:drug/metabolite transporter (DMT)-like permease
MEPVFVAAALASALLHAGWNAAVKASPRPAGTMTAQMVVGAALVVPALVWTGLPKEEAWGWIAASTILNTATVTALLRAYGLAGFGVVYPVVRALSVLLVVPLAAAVSGERVSGWGVAGVALVAGSLVLLGLGNRGERAIPAKALAGTLAAGLSTAAYVLCDAQGVRHAGSPGAYGFTVSITNALAMLWQQRAVVRASLRESRTGGAGLVRVVPIALAAMTSYLLILWVWSQAAIAPAAALRDTSAVFALLIAIVWLKEPFTPLRLLAILMSAAAVPLLRLA